MNVFCNSITVQATTLQHVQILTEVSHVLAMKVILAMEEDVKVILFCSFICIMNLLT